MGLITSESDSGVLVWDQKKKKIKQKTHIFKQVLPDESEAMVCGPHFEKHYARSRDLPP